MYMLDQLCIKASVKMHCWKEDVKKYFSEEHGAVNMIEIVVIVVIVMAVAAVFREKLAGLIEAIFTKVTNFVTNSTINGTND